MKLTLSCAATRVVLGESPPCALELTNDGAGPVVVPRLDLNRDAPVFRVRGPGDDEVAEHAPAASFARRGVRPLPEWPEDRPEVTLAPGETRRETFDLLERVVLPRPGRVEVEAVLRVGEPATEVTSAPLVLEVAPVDPRHVVPAHGQSGFDHQVFLAWVQGGEPAAVHVTAFDARRGRVFPRVSFRAGDADPEARPVVSTSIQGAGPERRVVAWLHEGVLRWASFGRRAPEPEPPAQLVTGPDSHLLGAPLVDVETSAPRAFVRLSSGAVRAFDLEAGTAETAEVELPPPAWSHLVAPADGGPRLFVATAGPEVGLHTLAWDASPRQVQRLGVWKGELAAAATVLCPDDDLLRGVLLLWFRRRPEEEPALVGVRWRLDPADGRFEASTPQRCGWDRRLGTPALRLRLDGRGEPHVLAQDDSGVWWYAPSFGLPCRVFPDDAASPPPRPVGPVDLVFAAEGRVPLLLHHEAEAGLRVTPLGAEPLPDPRSPEMTQPELEDR